MIDQYAKKYLPFVPQPGDDAEQNRSAYLLFTLGWVWAIVASSCMAVMVTFLPVFWLRAVKYIVLVDVSVVVCLAINHRGRFKQAAIILIMAFWCIVTHMALTAGGISAVSVVAYLPVIVTAGLLLGGAWGIGTAAVCILSALVMAVLDTKGILPQSQVTHTPLSLWMGYATSGILITILQYLANRQSTMAYKQLSAEVAERKKVEYKQEISDAKYRSLIEQANDAIMVTDVNGNFQDVNHTLCQMFGYDKEELLRMSINSMIDPEQLKREPIQFDLLAQGVSVMRERRMMHKNGTIIEVEANVKMCPDGTIVAIARDITERKWAQRQIINERDLSNSVINSLPGLFFILSEEGSFLRWNRNFEAISGYTKADILEMNALDFFDEDGKKVVSQKIAEILSEGSTEAEVVVITKSGNREPHYFTGEAIVYDGRRCLAVSGMDITERVDARNAINALNESLEKKVAERTAELHDANRELETFNYSVSHDLQAPLRLVNGFAKMLLKEYGDKLDDEGKHSLEIISTNTVRMSQLIRDLLEFSKSGRAILNKEEVDMNGMVLSIIDQVKMSLENPSTDFIVHELRASTSDANLIKQVWANLIQNAVKFSGKKERPVVEIGNHESDGELVYYVRDNGVGFDMQHQAKLFNAFQRLHSTSEFEGSGVGLATSHRIISRHGGRIWVDAKLNEGATFYFILPDGN